MRENESAVVLFITTVLSHLTMLPTPYLLYKRHYIFEFCCAVFGLLASLMYHSAESFGTSIFLTELEWHRLDNVGIIAMMGLWYVYLCCFQSPVVDMSCKCFCVFFTLVAQQKHPWDVRFTVAPILLFSLFPVVKHCLVDRRVPPLHLRHLGWGVFFVAFAVPCFVLGLNDHADPYRVYHGAWHFFGGLSSAFFWVMVKSPGCTGSYGRPQPGITLRGDAAL
ncbi:hypothetical protein NESM_000862200 [Novymonas esmeraldas]|uniref:Uncharacterized protein n=1 Tax=Novymonas esmeraldas TaxID=1808958 RepID=A0AAW0F0U3_9TRYP